MCEYIRTLYLAGSTLMVEQFRLIIGRWRGEAGSHLGPRARNVDWLPRRPALPKSSDGILGPPLA